MAITLVSLVVTQPTATVLTGAVRLEISGGTPGDMASILSGVTAAGTTDPMGTLANGNSLALYSLVPAGRRRLTALSGTTGEGIEFDIDILAVPAVLAAPPALAAAHLPVLLALQAEPSGVPLASAALVVAVDVYRAGGWQPAGLLREVCDPNGRAEFYLNEYLKGQFTPTPPDESGAADPALAIRYRARYGRAEAFDGTVGDEAGTVEGLALNAALPVNPAAAPLPLLLGPALPYAAVPVNAARFRSVVLADGSGVANVPTVPVSAEACAARQFVWLHPSGAWCWGLFAGRHEHGTETGEQATVRRPEGDYYAGGGDTRATLRVYSDVLDWPTFAVLRTIRAVGRVYERLPSGQYLPVLLERGASADYQETDKQFEVNFLARYPVQTVQTF